MSGLLAPEARLLLDLVTGERRDGIAAHVRDPGFDWDRLLLLALREKATPALREVAETLPADLLPEVVRTRFGAVTRSTHVHMMRLEQLLVESLDVLDAHGIEAILLKGAGLATTVYGSFPARPMYDVDLLIAPDDALRAWHALREAGWQHDDEQYPDTFYSSHYHLPPLHDAAGSGLGLEIHLAPVDGAIVLDGARLRAGAREVRVHGRRALVPARIHQVLHLAAHFAWTHGMASAGWRTFRDLHRLIREGLDWEAVVAEAARTRAGTSCYWTFRLARSLAGVDVPDGVLRRLQPARPEYLLSALERHYAATIFAHAPVVCPSVRVTQALWTMGMTPRASGHGDARPWHRGVVWAATHGGGTRPSFGTRVREHARRGGDWTRYLAGVLMARSTGAAPAHGVDS